MVGLGLLVLNVTELKKCKTKMYAYNVDLIVLLVSYVLLLCDLNLSNCANWVSYIFIMLQSSSFV